MVDLITEAARTDDATTNGSSLNGSSGGTNGGGEQPAQNMVLMHNPHVNGGVAIGDGQRARQTQPASRATVVLGAQWGDEGKGKLVDLLASSSQIVCRCQVSRERRR